MLIVLFIQLDEGEIWENKLFSHGYYIKIEKIEKLEKSLVRIVKKKNIYLFDELFLFNFGNITDNLNHLDLHFISDNKKLSFGFMEMS